MIDDNGRKPVRVAAAHVLDDNCAVLPGTLIGPFRVESFIGEGGHGAGVSRARFDLAPIVSCGNKW
jgi:hypothetical protein